MHFIGRNAVFFLILPLHLAIACGSSPSSETADKKHLAGNEAPLDVECPTNTDDDGDGNFRVDRTGCPDFDESTFPYDGDCDDNDPTRSTASVYYADGDGDGYGDIDGEMKLACDGDVIEGFTTTGYDCAPDDPQRQVERYRDEDGDGVGEKPECVAETSPGYSEYAGDCNDANSGVFPLAEEAPLDGVDSDCDGDDAPFFRCDGSTLIPAPEGVSCSGVGLAILARKVCDGRCGGGSATVSIVNMGTEASPGATVQVTLFGDLGTQQVSIPVLDPGEIYEIPQVQSADTFVIELPDGTMNCAPEQNTEARVGYLNNLC